MAKTFIGKKAGMTHINQNRSMLGHFCGNFWMISSFLCSHIIMEWYCFTLLHCGHRVVLSDVHFLSNCFCLTREY